MRWYLPTWNGDIRAEAEDDKTVVTIIKPTVDELLTLGRLEHQLREKGWWKDEGHLWKPVKDRRRSEARRQRLVVEAPLADIAPLLVAGYKPGEATLSAVVYRDGEVETVDGTQGEEALAEVAEKATKDKAEKAATVKRATPSCPQCQAGAIAPASEVLLDFLDERQHETWARDRRFVTRGGATGTRYLLAHRHSPTAVSIGRPCLDLDDMVVLHFHDQSVPPEEEALGAKLVLEHREPWLRNEATVLLGPVDENGERDFGEHQHHVFKNPFGDVLDGVADSWLTQSIGGFFAGLAAGSGSLDPMLDEVLEQLWKEMGTLVAKWTPDTVVSDPEHEEFIQAAAALARLDPVELAEVAWEWRRRVIASGASEVDLGIHQES